MSLVAWYKPESFYGRGNNPIIDKGYYNHIEPYYQFHIGVSGDQGNMASRFEVDFATDGNWSYAVTPAQFWSPGTWYHLVGTYDGSEVKLYVNGELISSNPASGLLTDYGSNIFFGRFTNLGGDAYTPGAIDEVRIYSGPLTESEIQELYRQCLAVSVSGTVTANSSGLLGVPVNLLDSGDALYSTMATDEFGSYLFEDVPSGNYTVEIQVPLGYTPTSDASVPVSVAGEDIEVNFTLEENPKAGKVRQAWFWCWQVKAAMRGWRWTQYSESELLGFLDDIHTHFDPHFPIYAGVDGLEGMNDVLSVRRSFPVSDRALKHFFATLLNVVSGRLNTFQVVSQDGATASQAITYMADLLMDADPDNDGSVILIALNINCAWFDLPTGIIPLDLPQIAYKSGDDVELPTAFDLNQNHPNPFNPVTEISYSLMQAGLVRLEVFNMLGQKIATLFAGYSVAGEHSIAWNASDQASGAYFYRLTAGELVETKKMMLLK